MTAAADSLQIRLEPTSKGGVDRDLEIVLTISDRDSDAEPREERISADVRGTAKIDLPAGRWLIEAVAEDYWIPGQPVDIEAGGQTLALRVWPLTELTGKLVPLHGAAIPADFSVRFSSVSELYDQKEDFEGVLVCETEESVLRCPIPIGSLDLELRPEGFIPHYRWAIEAEHGKTLELGLLALEHGASISGWVTTKSGADVPSTRIALLPRGLDGEQPPREEARLQLFLRGIEAHENGFFQLRNLPPGEYLLTASATDFAPATIDVSVLEGRESTLLHPLELAPPLTLEVWIDPPVDPDGQPWHLELGRLNRYSSHLLDVVRDVAAITGSWERAGLSAGPHLISLSRSSGEKLIVREFVLGEEPLPLTLEPTLVEVEGRLLLADEPLVGTIWFGGRRGAVRVETSTDEEGEYSALLPRSGVWRADVHADEPPVSRSLVGVEIPEPRGGESVDLDLELPETRLHGRVIEESGRPVKRGVVLVAAAEEKGGSATHRQIDEEGRFELHGLPEGEIYLHARTPIGRSQQVAVVLAEDLEPPEQELMVRARDEIEVLVTADGRPVPGARVMLRPVSELHSLAMTEITGPDGRFETAIDPGTREVVAVYGAPRFALTVARRPVVDGSLVLELSHAAGTLILELPEEARQKGQTWFPAVFHNGTILPREWRDRWVDLHPDEARDAAPGEQRIPILEPGDYAFCRVPHVEIVEWLYTGPRPAECDVATLSPGAAITLRLPE